MIVVTGAKGQLGFDVVKELEARNMPVFGIGRGYNGQSRGFKIF